MKSRGKIQSAVRHLLDQDQKDAQKKWDKLAFECCFTPEFERDM
jgi:hypothetical protein